MSEKQILLPFEGKLCGRYLNKKQRVLKGEGGPAPMWHASSASNEAVYPERGRGYHCEKTYKIDALLEQLEVDRSEALEMEGGDDDG